MYRKFLPLILIAESPVHAGSGSELGIVDLPIQRERYTNFPKIEGSGLKGCIREAFEGLVIKKDGKRKLSDCKLSEKFKKLYPEIENLWIEKDKDGREVEKTNKEGEKLINFDRYIALTFGPEEGDTYAGSISFTDAKILLFPVKSLKGVFAWITCPMVLHRFVEDMKFAGKVDSIEDRNFESIKNTIPNGSDLLISERIILEEFTFGEITEADETSKIADKLSDIIFPEDTVYYYWKDKLRKNLVVLADDDFQQFVTHSTEVITRTRIDSETGTVQSGALWTEEYLPQDSILYSIAMTTSVRVQDDKKEPFKGENPDEEAEKVMEFFKSVMPEVIHLGGNQTIGKGIVRINLWEVKNE